MIIVSQDRIKITDNLNLRIEVTAKEQGEFPNIQINPISYIIDKNNTQLGRYKTVERAKEVLEEIKYWQFQFELFKVVSAEKQEEMQDFFERYNREFNIYEMPAD